MDLANHNQDSTTEVLSTMQRHIESVKSDMKLTEINLAADIDKSKIDIIRNAEGTNMEIKDCINDSTKEVLTTINKHTESANSEIKLTIKDAEMTLNKSLHDETSKIMSAIESLHGHINALPKNVPISGENVTKCHSKYKHSVKYSFHSQPKSRQI